MNLYWLRDGLESDSGFVVAATPLEAMTFYADDSSLPSYEEITALEVRQGLGTQYGDTAHWACVTELMLVGAQPVWREDGLVEYALDGSRYVYGYGSVDTLGVT